MILFFQLSFPMEMESSSRGLNPEAPEFLPARNVQPSPLHYPPPTNPHFLHYATLYSPHSRLHIYPYFPHQHAAAPGRFFTQKTVAEPVHSSLQTVAGEVPTGRRNKRYGKEGFVRAKPSKYNREKHSLVPVRDDGKETTVMIKNIPSRYTRKMLKDFLDQHCMNTNTKYSHNRGGVADKERSFSAFDFLYLPIDFTTKSNKGYAFVNFTNPRAAQRFLDACHGQGKACEALREDGIPMLRVPATELQSSS